MPELAVDHRLQVIGQALVGVGVHRPDEEGVVKRAIAADLGVVSRASSSTRSAGTTSHGITPPSTVPRLSASGKAGTGNADGRGAELLEKGVGHPAGAAQLQAVEIRDGLDRRVGRVDHARSVNMDGQKMNVAEAFEHVRLRVVPGGPARRLARHRRS